MNDTALTDCNSGPCDLNLYRLSSNSLRSGPLLTCVGAVLGGFGIAALARLGGVPSLVKSNNPLQGIRDSRRPHDYRDQAFVAAHAI